ncbi:hypothetical protein BX600DRAFT_498964 [Xylariales sp. PMI_506]|nr:hypothetical protein BX600DRAFT_498964 [Xylariales sp. PMI_506]
MTDSPNWRDTSNWRAGGSPAGPQSGEPANRGWRTGGASRGGAGGYQSRGPNNRAGGGGGSREDPDTTRAIAEGRRIYLGNLLYTTTLDDVKEFLTANEFGVHENIHISVDSFSGRNPGYCFVEFADKQTADAAMEGLEGRLLFDRPVKCRPCQPRGAGRQQSDRAPYDGQQSGGGGGGSRWGSSWNSGEGGDRYGARGGEGGDRYGARGGQGGGRQFEVSKAQAEGRQLYVGGLPKLLDSAANDEEIRGIFTGFQVDSVGKRVTPRSTEGGDVDERRNFCFVDFSTPEEAQAALDAVDGSSFNGGSLKVSLARPRTYRQPEGRYNN